MITKVFFDSVEVVGDFNLANNSWMKVLSSFNKETTYGEQKHKYQGNTKREWL